MTAEIVNLRMARKRKARQTQAGAAEENRARHGLTLAERKRLKTVEDERERLLDGHRRDTPPRS
jgi:hypothetical protein